MQMVVVSGHSVDVYLLPNVKRKFETVSISELNDNRFEQVSILKE